MAIITLEDFKSYIGLDDTSEDVKLQMIVDAVNLSINTYVGRNLERRIYYGNVASVEVGDGGDGYVVGDVLVVLGTFQSGDDLIDSEGVGTSVIVKTVDGSGAVTEVTLNTTGANYLPGEIYTTTGGSGDACTISILTTLGESYDGTGTDALCLRNFPLINVAQVTVHGIIIPQWQGWNVAQRDALWGTYGWGDPYSIGWHVKDWSTGILFNKYCWPNGRGNINVIYEAGYDPIPKDIFLGTLEMAAFYRNVTLKPGIVSEWLGSYSVNMANSISAMNGELTIPDILFKMILDQERAKTAKELVF